MLKRAFFSYRSGWLYQVQIDGILSDEAPHLSRDPQGSAIGPLLFLFYLYDPPTTLGDSTILSFFADDVKMVFTLYQLSRLLFFSPGPGQRIGVY